VCVVVAEEGTHLLPKRVIPLGMAEKKGGNHINGCRQDNEKKEKFKRNHGSVPDEG